MNYFSRVSLASLARHTVLIDLRAIIGGYQLGKGDAGRAVVKGGMRGEERREREPVSERATLTPTSDHGNGRDWLRCDRPAPRVCHLPLVIHLLLCIHCTVYTISDSITTPPYFQNPPKTGVVPRQCGMQLYHNHHFFSGPPSGRISPTAKIINVIFFPQQT